MLLLSCAIIGNYVHVELSSKREGPSAFKVTMVLASTSSSRREGLQ